MSAAGETSDVVTRTAQTAYGRLIAYLSARNRDIAACEDALSAAFQAALETWPGQGVPERPEAWLLTAARNRLNNAYRRARVRAEAEPTLIALMDEAETMANRTDPVFPDDRLKLMFVCAHPAIAAEVRTPLMLQTVLGLSAERIASAFVVKPSAMAQRLSRAKAKIRDAGIAFEVPEAAEWPARLAPLLDAVYAAYGLGWGDHAGEDGAMRGLVDEALELGFALLALLQKRPMIVPELNGLLALILYCEARATTRFAAGAYVPLSAQNPAQWDWSMIDKANRLLSAAEPLRQIGRYQLEAAIQSVHLRRGVTGITDWAEIVVLYQGLLHYAPSLAAGIGYAAALGEARGAEAGLAVLDGIEAARIADYQPYWATRAHLLQRLKRPEADAAFERAIGLSAHEAQRAFLRRKQAQ